MKRLLFLAILILTSCCVRNLPPMVVLISPEDGAFVKSESVVLSWNAHDPENDPLTFDVYLYPSNSTPTAISTDSTSNEKIVRLKPLTDYEWFVVAEDVHGNVSTSSVWSFSTGRFLFWKDIPDMETLENSTLSTNLSIYVDSTCTPLKFDLLVYPRGATISETGLFTYTTDYESSGSHIVEPIVSNPCSETETTSFIVKVLNVNRPPEAPTLLRPKNGSSRVRNDTTFLWMAEDPDVEDSLIYEIDIWSDSSRTSIITDSTSIRIKLDYATTYSWNVIAIDPYGASSVSETSTFTTEYGKIYPVQDTEVPTVVHLKSDGVPELTAIEIDLSFSTSSIQLESYGISSVFSGGLSIITPIDEANESGVFSFAFAKIDGSFTLGDSTLLTLKFEPSRQSTSILELDVMALDDEGEVPVGTRNLILILTQ